MRPPRLVVYGKDQMGLLVLSGDYGTERHLIPGGNKQAVDRLDTPAAAWFAGAQSVTPAQPAQPGPVTEFSDYPMYQGVTERTVGVSDGFRTRDLRIHNPAL